MIGANQVQCRNQHGGWHRGGPWPVRAMLGLMSSRVGFEAAAGWFADTVELIAPDAWAGPGLGEWDLLSLVGHTSRSLITVATYFRQPVDDEAVPSVVAYYDIAVRHFGADAAAVTERGRQAGLALGADPARTVRSLITEADAALDDLAGDPLITTIAGGMRSSAYLFTRTFELTVHTLDIAVATGLPATPPPTALRDALGIAVELATVHGDGPALLLALTGRNALPPDFSTL